MTNATPTAQLSDAGVSIWLDDLSRERLASGSLQKLIDEKNVVGVTTNPSIFQAAITSGSDYDAKIAELESEVIVFLSEVDSKVQQLLALAGGKTPLEVALENSITLVSQANV